MKDKEKTQQAVRKLDRHRKARLEVEHESNREAFSEFEAMGYTKHLIQEPKPIEWPWYALPMAIIFVVYVLRGTGY